jgi:hypothetical protein
MNEEHPGWTKYISRIVKEASIEARNRALANGSSVLYQEKDGHLYEEHPDGTKTMFKKMEQQPCVKIKKRFKLV